ncbi:MAG TPA: SgcJ/EcaC family oxidoreductase [Steroidobacteraceae bacterium]|jgi:uncharacterized protein (TIGR02246 family)|nr:SgcJ/EcaC family oxidoreductase [Steroidobacteraceae bacterium]
MKSCETRNLWLLAPALAIYGSVACATTSDDAGIRQLQVQQADAWNRHDAAAYAALFTEDGDCVNVLGWWWKGRAEIQKQLTAAFAFVFRESQLTVTETTVRFLTPAIAVAHVRWTMSGAKTPPGMPEPKQGIEIQVLQKKAGHWLIESFQNTNGIPERPFPAGSPANP